MYRKLILEQTPILLFALLALSATIKVFNITKLKYKESNTELFFRSFFLYSKDVIRNTNHQKLKAYYRKNNRLNTLIYFPFITLLLLYSLMKIIS
jgi:hypothetical protein